MFWLTSNPKKAVRSCFSPQRIFNMLSPLFQAHEKIKNRISCNFQRCEVDQGHLENLVDLSLHRWTTVWVFKDIIIHSAHIETRCISFGDLFLKLYDLIFRVQIL